MRFRFDHLLKKSYRQVLARRGDLDVGAEVSVDAQRIDMAFRPHPAQAAQLGELGLLGRMVGRACLLEMFHEPPSFDEIRGCMRKLLSWHHLQVLRSRREERAAARARREDRASAAQQSPRHERAGPDRSGTAPVRPPVLWMVTSVAPPGVAKEFALRPSKGWPAGVYATPQPGVPVRMVVVSELPATRETLLLRFAGRGSMLVRAMRELLALPEGAVERAHLEPIVVEWLQKLGEAGKKGLLDEEKELLVNGQKLVEAIERRGREQGFTQGIQEGRQEGRREGLLALVHQFARRLGRPVTDRERATLERRLDTLGPDRLGDVVLDLEPAALAAWLSNPRAR